jgi:hypothetical protein
VRCCCPLQLTVASHMQAMGNRKQKLKKVLCLRRHANPGYRWDPVFIMHHRSYFFDKSSAGIGFWITSFWNFVSFLSSVSILGLVATRLSLYYEEQTAHKHMALETEADLHSVARFGYMLFWWLHLGIFTNVLIEVRASCLLRWRALRGAGVAL